MKVKRQGIPHRSVMGNPHVVAISMWWKEPRCVEKGLENGPSRSAMVQRHVALPRDIAKENKKQKTDTLPDVFVYIEWNFVALFREFKSR